ncbi:hypothetical protein EBU71_12265 [bacterium]|nr:hypothetical protein [Candidatus Elulimicrobium humile]
MIEKIIHQIWVGPNEIPTREWEASRELVSKHPSWQWMFWTDANLPNIPEDLRDIYDLIYDSEDYVFCADMLRWIVVHDWGGWYLDIDWKCNKNLDQFFEVFSQNGYFSTHLDQMEGIVFGHWGGGYEWLKNREGEGWDRIDHTVTNNIFYFQKSHPLTQYMIENIPRSYFYGNPPCSPHWTGETMKKWLGLEMEFTQDVWQYHSKMHEEFSKKNIEYASYNTFLDLIMSHLALYSWSREYKEKLESKKRL